MKILAASDIHGDIASAKKLAEKARKANVDLIVLNGDIVEEAQPEGIVGLFKGIAKVLILPGNHETVATTDFLATLYDETNLHGYSIKVNDIGIFGCGGADIGPHPVADSEIFDNLHKGFKYIKESKKKIMVTHVHPQGGMADKIDQFVPGSKAVKKAIKQFKPDILLCGHAHHAAGIEETIGKTRVINVGKEGKIIEL
jgi:uncharacterized protein